MTRKWEYTTFTETGGRNGSGLPFELRKELSLEGENTDWEVVHVSEWVDPYCPHNDRALVFYCKRPVDGSA